MTSAPQRSAGFTRDGVHGGSDDSRESGSLPRRLGADTSGSFFSSSPPASPRSWRVDRGHRRVPIDARTDGWVRASSTLRPLARGSPSPREKDFWSTIGMPRVDAAVSRLLVGQMHVPGRIDNTAWSPTRAVRPTNEWQPTDLAVIT